MVGFSRDEEWLSSDNLFVMSKRPFSNFVAARLCIICLALTGLANSSPAPGDKDDTRAAALRSVTDQEELVEIATNDYSPLVRAAAVRQLTDRFQIARIALEDDSKDGSVRAAAIEKLSDLDLLTRIALGEEKYRNGLSPEVFLRLRNVAAKRIEDQDLLAQVAMEEIPLDTTKDGSIRMNARILRMTAVDKLTDQTQLTKVALEGKASDTRKAALQKLRDPALLATVMQEDTDTELRDAARAKLSKALLRAATDGDTTTVRLLSKSFALDLRDANGRTLLMLASESGRVEVAKFLLDSGVDVNEENVIQDYVRMPNGAAVYPGPTMTAEVLSSNLPGSIIVPGRRETALSLTSPATHPETRDLLIKAGAK
jgi:hypothetical protein